MDSLKGQLRTPLTLDSPTIRGSHFSDLLSHISGRQEFDIELSIFNRYDFKWTIRHLPELKTHVVSHYYSKDVSHYYSKTDIRTVNAQWLAKPLKQKEEYEVQINNDEIYKDKLYFYGLLVEDFFCRIDDMKFDITHNENTHVQWLTSVRKPPLRHNLGW